MQPCLLQCSHASPSYWISSARQFDVDEVQKLLCFQEHLSAQARAHFITSCDQEQN